MFVKKVLNKTIFLKTAVFFLLTFSLFSNHLFAFEKVTYLNPLSETSLTPNWNLKDLYPSKQAWQDDYTWVQSNYSQINKYQNTLALDANNILACLKLQESISRRLNKLYQYAKLQSDTDLSDNNFRAMLSDVQQLNALVSSSFSFITPELLDIKESQLTVFLQNNPALSTYQKFFNDLFRLKKHYLPPNEEKILANLTNLANAPANIFTVLSGSDMPFPKIKYKNQEIILNYNNYQNLLNEPDRKLRKQAFETFNNTFSQYRNTYAEILKNSIQFSLFFAKERNFASTLDSALYPEDIPINVYDNLIKTVNENLKPLHQYFTLRKKLLNVDDLKQYDLFCPIVLQNNTSYSFAKAQQIVVSALSPLGKEYQENLQKAFKNNWIDLYPKTNKISGAYSWGIYDCHPYILLNYNNKLNDVSTLAHELGHAMHSYFTNQTQPYQYADYAIFCAETASTVNENLLYEFLLKQPLDKETRLNILIEYLENIRSTVYMQTMLSEFEKTIHDYTQQGIPLTADLLSDTYNKLLKKYYGNTVSIDPSSLITWTRISHFYRNFYVYQYATGYSAAYAITKQLLENKPNIQESYLEFLRSGNSDTPINLLKKVNVDMSSPEPIKNVLEKFQNLLCEVELLTKQS